MKNKYMPATIANIVGLVCYLFLPAFSLLGQDVTMMDILTTDGFGGGEGSIYVLIPLIAGIVGIIGGLKKKKGASLIGGIGGAAGIVLFVVKMADLLGASVSEFFNYVGIGLCFALIAFAVAAAAAWSIKNDAE